MSGGLFWGMSCAKREQIPSTIRVISSFFHKVSFHLRRSATRDLNLARAVGGDGHANRCKTVFRLIILLRKRRNQVSENERSFVRRGGAFGGSDCVGQRICNQQVVGSNPTAGSLIIKNQPKADSAEWPKMQASNLRISFYFFFKRARQ